MAPSLKGFWAKLKEIDLNPETAFKRKRLPPCPRSVYMNEPLPAEAFDHKGKPHRSWTFSTNQVLTAKYTVYNFIFKNLLEQFRRVANIFFLILVILQFFPKFYTISPGLAMLPLLVVLAITAAKDGYEDLKRHQSDSHINGLKVSTLHGGGWHNPNVMEEKSRSVSSVWRTFWARSFGGKKRESDRMRKEQGARASMAIEHGEDDEAPMVSPMEPPGDAPGGGSAQGPRAVPPVRSVGEPHLGLVPEGEVAPYEPTSPTSPTARHSLAPPARPSRQLRRHSTVASSAFESEYEHHPDGTITRKDGGEMTDDHHMRAQAKKAPRWKRKDWEDLAVGDFIFLRNNEAIPADVVICATSEEEDSCFIETKNLDGETNLKSRHAIPELTTLRTPADCMHASLRIDSEAPDTNMYRLNASVVMGDRLGKDGQPLRCPVTLNQVLLRGCNLRNTEWVIGIVLMTGVDTKIIANSGDTPSKRGKVEKQMNPMVYVNLLILACMAVGCAIADARIENHFFDLDAYWEFRAIFGDDNPNINGLVTFGNSLITFQNIVPISLYISIEFVRTIQAYFIYDDHDIFYDKTSRRTTARSWNLSDDLGQIQYIFSDKTGTLTQNLMIFRECSIAGVTYRGAQQESEPQAPTELSLNEKSPSFSDSSTTQRLSDEPGRKKVKLSADGVAPFKDQYLANDLKDPGSAQGQALGRFFRCLALCHTVLTAEDEAGVIEYKAQSPDEQALVQAAADVGFVFCGKDRSTLKLQTPYSTKLETFELLTVIEFSSARKRMSVIVRREEDGQVLLLTKGADSIIFERSAKGQDALKEDTDKSLEGFANNGLRTLCLAYRELPEDLYEEWSHEYHEASVALERREERMEELASELERDLVLLGATAIEDRLQEGVPETIADLKRAGINVWVATGDKLETAIAIGYSTLLLSKDMNLIVVRGGEYGSPNSAYEQLKRAVERFFGGHETLREMEHQPPDVDPERQGRLSFMRSRPSLHRGRNSTVSQASIVGEDNGQRPGGYALVIDGAALTHALSEEFSKDLLLRISTQCKAVICCRVSPLQKALIVRLIKDGLGVMTLAIGDGANDVSMIQAAHVGIGIAGEEGLQAVNSSDYAIAQFRFLKRLLLVHGHWSYYRNSNMINNFFYKEIINIGYLFWFQIYCAWSTTQALDYVYLLFWNAFWTVAAVIGIGIFDRDVSDRVLMEVPELYRRGREGKYFGLKPFLIYMLDGTYQSVVLFFFIAYTYDTTTSSNDGYDIQLYEWTTVIAIASVLAANMFTGLNTLSWTWWIVFAVWIGPLLIWIFAPIYAAFGPETIWTYSYGNNHYLYRSILFWLGGIFCVVLCLLPRLIAKHLRQTYYPTDIDVLRVVDKFDPKHDYVHDPSMPAMRARSAYADGTPGGADMARISSRSSLPGHEGFPMQALQPTASRASSTHYDMLTGTERPNRGFTFSAEDYEPRRQKRKLTVKGLIPGTLKRSMRKREERRLATQAEAEREEDDNTEARISGPEVGQYGS